MGSGSGSSLSVTYGVGTNTERVDWAVRVNPMGVSPESAHAYAGWVTSTSTETDTVTTGRPDLRPDHGDHERFSHYADRDKITEASVM